jgi:hypothetical protein
VKEYYDITHIVFIHAEDLHGTVEKLGAYASTVSYIKDGIEYKELMENEEFTIVDEIVFTHIEDSN